MAVDARSLREDANAAAGAGKFKRALDGYLALEKLDPTDAQWPRRAGEMLRKLGRNADAIIALDRAADRYLQGGFLVQAIAICKLILQIDANHVETQRRIARINDMQGAGQTRIGVLADAHPSLHANPSVAMLRERSGRTSGSPATSPGLPALGEVPVLAKGSQPGGAAPSPVNVGLVSQMAPAPAPALAPDDAVPEPVPVPDVARRRRESSRQRLNQLSQRSGSSGADRDAIAVPRTVTPIFLEPGAAIESVALADVMPGAHRLPAQPGTAGADGRGGIVVIPLPDDVEADGIPELRPSRTVTASATDVAIEIDDVIEDDGITELDATDLEEAEMMPADDIEEIRLYGSVPPAARQALAETPLFASLPAEAFEALVARLELVSVVAGELVFREGEAADALYVISEGEVAVTAEGPPRVELSRLGPGAFFGELALITDQPRTASIIASAPSELLKIDRAVLRDVLAAHPDVVTSLLRFVRDRLVDRLVKTSPLFRPFDDAERRAVAARFRFLEIDAGSPIIMANTKVDALYVILSGHVSIDGTDVLLGPGDLLGEASLLSGAPAQVSARAYSKCLALGLPAREFRELIMTHPHVLEVVGEAAEAKRSLEIY